MRHMLPALLIGVMMSALPAQTLNAPCVNDYYVLSGIGLPPLFTPCGGPAVPVPTGSPVTFIVETTAPGLPVAILVDAPSCTPGFFCLPPVAGPYAAIPPAMPPCGPATNQSLDLSFGFMTAASGVTSAGFFCPGQFLVGPLTFPPAASGISFSTQAVIFDPAAGLFGIVVTEAFDVILM